MKRKLCFVDVETTGLHSHLHTICEIAIIRDDGVTFCAKVKLTNEQLAAADPRAFEVNQYDPAEYLHAMSAYKAAKESAKVLQGCKVVGHNVHFDVAFLREFFADNDIDCSFSPRLIDTQVIAYEQLHFLHSLSLDNIRALFGWSLEGAHSALVDAQDCKRLYYKICRANIFQRCIWRVKHWLIKKVKCCKVLK